MARCAWELFEHGADVGVRGIGATREAAFEQAGLALTGVIADPRRVRPRDPVRIHCRAPDDELLLLDWLNALVTEMTLRRMLFGRFEVHLADGELDATAWGEPLDPDRHRPAVEVKAATCSELEVSMHGDEWVAQTVVDV
ncbi:MAG: archease [Rhodocyclaceae bacterium]|nr:archease [Rhodocyclaceae bacterium]